MLSIWIVIDSLYAVLRMARSWAGKMSNLGLRFIAILVASSFRFGTGVVLGFFVTAVEVDGAGDSARRLVRDMVAV